MRRDHHAVLFRVVRDTKRLREAGSPRRIELDEPDRAGIDEVAYGEAVPFAFAMRQRDR